MTLLREPILAPVPVADQAGSSGGFLASSDLVEWEIADPFVVTSDAVALTFSLLPDGTTQNSGTVDGLAAGLYLLQPQIEVTRPVALYVSQLVVALTVSGVLVTTPQWASYPDGHHAVSTNSNAPALLVPVAAGDGLSFAINTDCVDGTASPDPLTVGYFYMSGRRIA